MSYLAGKLVELRGAAAPAGLSAGLDLVRCAQEAGETVVWVTATESLFFPPDAARGGVTLEALPVVRLPGAMALLRAADKLARSGAFGLIMLDFVSLPVSFSVSLSQQSRLLGLAQKHQVAVVFLTYALRPFSVSGSLISLRGQVTRRDLDGDLHDVQVQILKDKQRGPGWTHAERFHGPAGLR
jgi:recombination protein RecA